MNALGPNIRCSSARRDMRSAMCTSNLHAGTHQRWPCARMSSGKRPASAEPDAPSVSKLRCNTMRRLESPTQTLLQASVRCKARLYAAVTVQDQNAVGQMRSQQPFQLSQLSKHSQSGSVSSSHRSSEPQGPRKPTRGRHVLSPLQQWLKPAAECFAVPKQCLLCCSTERCQGQNRRCS